MPADSMEFGTVHSSRVLSVFGGRILGASALRDSSNAWSPTAYNGEGLIVTASDPGAAAEVGTLIRDVLMGHSCQPDGPPWLTGDAAAAGPDVVACGVRIVPMDDPAGAGRRLVPDPWPVLEQIRSRLDPSWAASVGLNHLMTSAEQVGGNQLAVGHGRVGLDGYGISGSGAHGSVNLLGPAPRTGGSHRRPRVVVLDTGIGDHPWFRRDPPATTVKMADGRIIGPDVSHGPNSTPPPDGDSASIDPLLGALPTHAGHGTFIAGLLRQSCPEADIVALTVMQANGIVPEHKLIRALDLLRTRQLETPGWADAIVLSLGYYSETDDDAIYTSGLKNILLELGRLGIAVFAAAGNDATSRPSYPAALSIDPDFADPAVLPVVAVAALNPDGSVAPFSNDGPWVTAEAIGVNLVSASPALPDGGGRPGQVVRGPGGRLRTTKDPDDYRSGFAVWSGTSFAAPILAAKYLRRLTAGFPSANSDRRELLPLGRRKLASDLDRYSPPASVSLSPVSSRKSKSDPRRTR